MNKKIQTAVQKQINEELTSAYVYLAMSAYAEKEGWGGTASWLRIQAQEEIEHAMKFYQHLVDRDIAVAFSDIVAPKKTPTSFLNIFESSLQQEKHVTKCIHHLYDLATKEGDHALQSLLNWFVDEQVEEESSIRTIIDKVKLVGKSGEGLYLIDQELGQRKAE